jgi:polyisoprenoid-binding protein YceI
VALFQPGAVTSFEVEIPVLSLKSDKDGLDKRMYKALRSDEHRSIVLRVDRYAVEPPYGAVTPLKVTGTLTVAGVERPVELTLETQLTPDGLAVAGQQRLLMTDFGIKPPSFMLGTLKTRNEIAIRFSLLFALSHS